MTARDEQETTVTAGRDESVVRIWSNNVPHVRKLRKNPRVTQTSGDEFEGFFEVDTTDYDPLIGFRRKGRAMTDEQRAAAAERLANARKENAK